jgi:acyl-CoA thioesterase FadM
VGVAVPEIAGFRFVAPIEPEASDFDAQGHLNNAAIVRLFNDLRIMYIQSRVGPPYLDYLAHERATVLARELHVLYETEGQPDEQYAGGVRIAGRSGRACFFEQALVEATTGRGIAQCWTVHLLVRDGRVVDWPALYWELVAGAEGAPVHEAPPAPRSQWGPPV